VGTIDEIGEIKMLDLDLIKNVLIIAIASSIITTAFVQKIKESFAFKKSNRLVIVAFVVSMAIGTLFALSFSDIDFVNALWSGLISFIGADTIYKMFEDKIFKPFGEIHKEESIEVPKDNIIK
jgi:hypothetical protein